MLGNGAGTFGPFTDFVSNIRAVHATSVVVADLDGDGHATWRAPTTTTTPTGVGSVLLGHGDGTLDGNDDYQTGLPYSVAIGDLNGDGRPDAAVANFASNSVSVLLNVGGPGNMAYPSALKPHPVSGTGLVGCGPTPRGPIWWSRQLPTSEAAVVELIDLPDGSSPPGASKAGRGRSPFI